jgi:20S proteasome subunit alpha 6
VHSHSLIHNKFQGTACLGLRSKTHVVLAGLKRSPSELASYQKKLVKIDDHMGVGMSGLTADGRSLVKYMRTEALNHKYVYGTPMQGSRLVIDVADMHQRCTQSYVRRPYGVGLLVATYDQTGPHLYQTLPSGEYFECQAMAIGSRSQTSKTYLEREIDNFPSCTLDQLITHALKALSVSLAGETELDSKSASIAVVGVDKAFEIIDGEALQVYLDRVDQSAAALGGNPDELAGANMEMEEPDI